MNALSPRAFFPSEPLALSQGTLVTYELPYARPGELIGRQKGIVLSGDAHNYVCQRPCICPVVLGENPINDAWGIKVSANSSIPAYLRPDLASYIGIPYGHVSPVLNDSGNPCVVSAGLTKRTVDKYIEIISPTVEKLGNRGQGFLAYGEIGWFAEFPRNYEDRNDPAPVINLTPPELYRETGIALVARGFTHLERFNAHYNVMVGAQSWFDTAFFSVTEIEAVSITRLAKKSGKQAFSAGLRALKGMAKKAHGNFDPEARTAVTERYNTPKGVPPSFIIHVRQTPTPRRFKYS